MLVVIRGLLCGLCIRMLALYACMYARIVLRMLAQQRQVNCIGYVSPSYDAIALTVLYALQTEQETTHSVHKYIRKSFFHFDFLFRGQTITVPRPNCQVRSGSAGHWDIPGEWDGGHPKYYINKLMFLRKFSGPVWQAGPTLQTVEQLL